jgi:hypothetical protein
MNENEVSEKKSFMTNSDHMPVQTTLSKHLQLITSNQIKILESTRS